MLVNMWRKVFPKRTTSSFHEFREFVRKNEVVFIAIYGHEPHDYVQSSGKDYTFTAIALAVTVNGFHFTYSDRICTVEAKHLMTARVGQERKKLLRYMETMCELASTQLPATHIFRAYLQQHYASLIPLAA